MGFIPRNLGLFPCLWVLFPELCYPWFYSWVLIPVGFNPSVHCPEHSQFAAQTAVNRFFQKEHGAYAEGDFEAEYCAPDIVYDPPSALPTFAADGGPSGTHLSAELGTHERAGSATLLEQHSGAFATAPGNLTTAAECASRSALDLYLSAVGCRATRLRNAGLSLSNIGSRSRPE